MIRGYCKVEGPAEEEEEEVEEAAAIIQTGGDSFATATDTATSN